MEMEDILFGFFDFLQDELRKEKITDFKDIESNTGISFDIDNEYRENRVAVLMAMKQRIELLTEFNNIIQAYDELAIQLKKRETLLAKVEKMGNVSLEVKNALDTLNHELESGNLLLISGESDLKEAKEFVSTFKKNNLTVEKLKKVSKFIESDCGVAISQKHIDTFKSIPDLTEDELKSFNEFSSEYNGKIKDKELISANKEKHREEMAIEKHKKLVEERKSINKQKIEILDVEHFEFKEEELVDTLQFHPNEKSLLLFNNFLNGNIFEDIKLMFPKVSDSSYYNIKKDLITLLTNELDSIYEEIENGNTEFLDLATIYEDSLDDVCNYFKEEETVVTTESSPREDKVNLFFSETSRGNHYIYDDIDQFEDDKKEDILTLVNKLKEKKFTNNQTQQKKLTNNKQLKGIFELKKPSIRLIYKELGFNNYYVLMVLKKNSSNDREIAKNIIMRNRMCEEHFNYIKDNVNDVELKNEGKVITKNITTMIKGNKSI